MMATPFRIGAALGAALLLALAAPVPPGAETPDDRSRAVANETITQRVDAAFAEARTGDFAPAGALDLPDAAIVAAVPPYLDDDNPDVRRLAVTLLGRTGSVAAAPHLAEALSDPSDSIASRAAAALYAIGADAAKDTSVAAALRAFLGRGNDDAGAILLTGYTGATESMATLKALREAKAGMVTKVFQWSPAAPVPLVVDVALARLGDADAGSRVIDAIDNGDLATLVFLLHVIRDIEESAVLRALADTALGDHRPVEGDVPSHADIGIRLADVAAVAFAGRFDLDVGIGPAADRRLERDRIEAVREALEARLPQ